MRGTQVQEQEWALGEAEHMKLHMEFHLDQVA